MHPDASRTLFEEEVAALSSRLLQQRSWTLNTATFPLIDVTFGASGRTSLRVQLHCENWNDLPPSISLHVANGTFLTTLWSDPTSVFNGSAHPATGRPFVCMAGSLEYHTHSSHLGDSWGPRRTDPRFTLFGIATQVWHAWRRGSG